MHGHEAESGTNARNGFADTEEEADGEEGAAVSDEAGSERDDAKADGAARQ